MKVEYFCARRTSWSAGFPASDLCLRHWNIRCDDVLALLPSTEVFLGSGHQHMHQLLDRHSVRHAARHILFPQRQFRCRSMYPYQAMTQRTLPRKHSAVLTCRAFRTAQHAKSNWTVPFNVKFNSTANSNAHTAASTRLYRWPKEPLTFLQQYVQSSSWWQY
jgi:hypothetical protein